MRGKDSFSVTSRYFTIQKRIASASGYTAVPTCEHSGIALKSIPRVLVRTGRGGIRHPPQSMSAKTVFRLRVHSDPKRSRALRRESHIARSATPTATGQPMYQQSAVRALGPYRAPAVPIGKTYVHGGVI